MSGYQVDNSEMFVLKYDSKEEKYKCVVFVILNQENCYFAKEIKFGKMKYVPVNMLLQKWQLKKKENFIVYHSPFSRVEYILHGVCQGENFIMPQLSLKGLSDQNNSGCIIEFLPKLFEKENKKNKVVDHTEQKNNRYVRFQNLVSTIYCLKIHK
jgi:hypothetical protein